MADAGAITILALVKSDPRAWAFMPAVLERVRAFCERYDLDSTPHVLSQTVIEHFVVDEARSSVRALVALREERIVGHCLVSLEAWCGTVYATVVQYEMDEPLPTQQVRDTLEQVEWWAKGKGATVLRVLACLTDSRGPARIRAFQSLYGFRPTRQILDKEIS
jgi:hypothetical protein